MYYELKNLKELQDLMKEYSCEKPSSKISYNKFVDDWGSHFQIAFPGLKKDEISVKIKGNKTIYINTKVEKKEVDFCVNNILIPEEITIDADPSNFNLSAIKVKLESGMLYVDVPFVEKPSDVDVNIE